MRGVAVGLPRGVAGRWPLLLGAAALLLAAAAPPAGAARPVRVGINRDYPPYEYLDRNGHPAGFDVDLVRAVADIEGLRVEFRADEWDRLVERFKAGELDALAGLLYSREREQFASFSTPHLVVHYSLFVRDGDDRIHGGSDLRGRRVLVERGSQMHESLAGGALGAVPVPVASEPEALRQLAAGQGDAAVVPQLEGLVLAKQRQLRVRQVGGPLLTRELCFAVRPDEPELLSRLNTALAVLYQTGRYATIYKRSFGEPLTESTLARWAPWVLGTLGLLVLALVAVGLWNRSLGRQVGLATRRLREANAEILKREQFLDAVIHNLPVAVFAKDPRRGFVLTLWNNRCEEMFGIPASEALGRTDQELFPAAQAETFLASDLRIVADRRPVESLEQPALSRSHGVRLLHTRKLPLLDERGEVTLVLAIAEDITDRNAMEAALRESRRLEGLGVLAGGIAHDFNNLLTAILGNLGLAVSRLPAGHAAVPLLRTVETTALRAADLTRQMLAYAGKAALMVQPLDLNQASAEMAGLLQVSMPAGVTLRHEPAADLPAIQADPAQIQQVLLNLLTNSADAIGQAQGEIVVATSLEQVTEAQRPALHPASPPLTPGRCVVLRVTDTGVGMPQETIARIFDPFFTTKFAGHGLGLSAILGILKAHGAAIGVASAPGRGTEFTIYFPALDGEHAAARPREAAAGARAPGGVILLAEDVEPLRETTASMLRHLGYEVLEAANGDEAVASFARDRERIRLVLTDLTMPGLNGLGVARAIHEIDPAARVLLMSGYPATGEGEYGQASDLAGFLPKPFRLSELRTAVETAMGPDGR